LTGKPTIKDADEVITVFGERVSVILTAGFGAVPPERRRSATIVDLTQPSLYRECSVPTVELAAELRRLELGSSSGADVRRL
jgi:tRNA A37 threonylcarbamoyladenosine synthetase subunit TsaC/SUA5/YrdC